MYGELIPIGGGDTIPLLKKKLLVGRRESCDIILRFANVSAHHCQLYVSAGYWYVRDENSRNGTKVNGVRISTDRRLDPGMMLSVAKQKYEVRYSPLELGAVGPPPADDLPDHVLGQSLMERAGLERRPETSSRYEVKDDGAGKIRRNIDKPI
jgi:pSer/pThr/pTyr-binding forkhead associated (FHA) protein